MKKAHRYNMAVTGNCHYLSYVDDQSDIKWMCWPYMDSSFLFGSLLDEQKGGHFKIVPSANFQTEQRYLQHSAIILTHFKSLDENEPWEFEVIDFAPRFQHFERINKPLQFFRKIKRITGQPRIKIICDPRGNYGEIKPIRTVGSHHISYKGIHYPIRLTSNVSKTFLMEETYFSLTEDLYLILSSDTAFEMPIQETYEEYFYKTLHYWRAWVKDTFLPNIFQKEIIRSAITLKIHQFEDTGAIIASGTTSLPEYPGSGRNWDYRYCWLRDSYFSLAALNSLGHFEEVQKYLHFINNILYDISNLQPVYKINGDADITEKILPLKGYLHNGPVRVGNEAFSQRQFDSFGQVILSLLPLYMDERILYSEQLLSLDNIKKLLKEIEFRMDEPDSGIWEFRGKQEKHLETYIFHWAGARASEKMASHYDDLELMNISQFIKIEAQKNIEKCYSHTHQCYMADQSLEIFDASAFLLIIFNYLDPNDKKTHHHFYRLQSELLSPEGMIYRYQAPDDFGETKATFLICTYWYIESLICLGFLDEAEEILRNIIRHENHVGLLSEDLSSEDGSQWGNFPQTYGHVGLINSVTRLARKRDKLIFE